MDQDSIDEELLADVQAIADSSETEKGMKTLARAVLMLAGRSARGKSNTIEAFEQIEELSKRQRKRR